MSAAVVIIWAILGLAAVGGLLAIFFFAKQLPRLVSHRRRQNLVINFPDRRRQRRAPK